MRLRSLRVRSFGCVEQARIDLRPGLNVLYGPNDLGKSTLVHAIRAALLLPASHREAENFRPWHRDAVPEVTIVFSAPEEPGASTAPRTWRLHKSFGGRKAQAELSSSKDDGEHFTLEQKGNGVDNKLREMLGWGVPQARARGPRGFPGSFLSTVLLGPQAIPGSVLGHSLDDDPNDSGRERLTEALQALAQDPQFKDILDRAQGKVDEAFTPTGKPRKGKSSPLTPVKLQVKQLSERLRDLDVRVHESDDVRQEVLRLDAQRAEAIVARDEAEQVHREVVAAYARAQRRAEIRAKVDEAQQALEQARQRLAERKTWHEAVERHLLDCPAAEASLARAREAETAAAHELVAAEAAKRAVDEGGDAQARLERQELETRRLRLKADHEQAHARLRTLDELLELSERVEQAREQEQALDLDVAAAQRAVTSSEAAAREAEGESRLYDAALRLRRWASARDRVAAAEAEHAEAERLRGQADAQHAAATTVIAELDGLGLPTAEVLETWRELDEQRRLAEARLGVGISAVVRRAPEGLTPIGATRDDGETASLGLGEAVEAERALVLTLGNDTEIEIRGGAAGARAEHEALQRQWIERVVPALSKHDAKTLAGLFEQVQQARGRRAKAERELQAAASKRSVADARAERGNELPQLRETLAAAEQALAGLDRETLEQRTAELSESEVQARKAHALARVDEARHKHSEARSTVAALTSQRQARADRHKQLAEQLREAASEVSGDPQVERDRAFDRLSAVEGEQEAIEAELVELDEAQAKRRAAADAVFREAQAEADQAKAARAHAEDSLTQRREALAEAQGRLAELEATVRRFDEAALTEQLDAHRQALREVPDDPEPVDEDAVTQAQAQVDGAQHALRTIEAELDQHRGALKQVGGAVAREEADRTREALDASKQAERDLELDYEAWRLLAQTLREAETAEGRHLGDALGDPIRERFAALTAGRYGGLSLGRDLKAQGLEAAGDLRDVGAFSEGVQDQLATILRLAVAENLGTALVLDDHLAQTDPGRVAWFRGLLDDVGDRAQIVVLTCRPEDYLREGETVPEGEGVQDSERVRAIDLTSVIERA